MKEAVILAGGLGTRLQSVVNDKPKCMATVAEMPFLKYLFDYLEREKFTHVILALGYKSEYVLNWLSLQKLPFSVSYVIEEEPLGTGGAIQLALGKSECEDVFVLNGDTYFDVDTNKLYSFYRNQNANIALALKPMTDFDRYGSVDIDIDGHIICFNEKEYRKAGLINGGVYLLNKNIFDTSLPLKYSFEKEILEGKIGQIKIDGNVQDSYFIDIGIPEDYEKANIDFLNFNK